MKEEVPEDNQQQRRKGFFASLGKRIKENSAAEEEIQEDEELKDLVQEGHDNGVIADDEADIINNIIDFAETQAHDVMVHRTSISAVDEQSSMSEVFEQIMREGYSRYPVYSESLDQILGVFHIRDFIKIYVQNEGLRDVPLSDIGEKLKEKFITEAYSIPETQRISKILREMQSRKVHMAIVVDEYGQTAGLVTMEDIMEEIFGNIEDEHDKEEAGIVRRNDGNEFIIDGLTELEDISAATGIDFGESEVHTLNGFLTGRLGHIPEKGEKFECDFGGFRFSILEVDNKIVKKARAVKL